MSERIIRGDAPWRAPRGGAARSSIHRLPRRRPTRGGLGILYENDAWLGPLLDALDRVGVPYETIDVQDAAFPLLAADRHALYLNRVSPSSALRGHDPAIRYTHALLTALESGGTRVANGAASFRMETSKVRQQLLMDALGVDTPRTLVFNNRANVIELARDFVFPAIIKPDTGGSGALVRRIESHAHLERVLSDEEHLFGPEHLLLLQELIESPDGSVVRTEFVDGELVFAMRVTPRNTFNLCPADGCKRSPASAEDEGGRAEVHFALERDIPEDAVDRAREIVRAARLDVGGVEYMETADGRRVFYDINATSVYRDDIQRAAGVDAFGKLGGFLARELARATIERFPDAGEGPRT